MEYPPADEVVKQVIQSLGPCPSDEEIDAHIADLGRMTDEELEAVCTAPEEAHPQAPAPLQFAPVVVKRRHDGWTAERQRAFIAALAETGCVSEACAEVGITPRSAYRLREHPKARAFSEAWDHAISMASARLASIAFERAIHGSVERIYRNGELVEERRKTSDKLLMWLLGHIDPVSFGWLSRAPRGAPDISFYKLQHARKELPKQLRKMSDIDAADCPAEQALGTDLDPYGDTAQTA